MTGNCDSPNSVLSDVFQELNPKAPPAPLDLLSTVSSVFHQRSEKFQREALARTDAEIEAGFVATREARIKEKLELLEEVDEEWEEEEEISEDEWDEDEYEDEIPSREDVEAFINGVIAKEATGHVLERAIGETIEDHRKRMKTLEDRIQGYQLSKFVLEDLRGDPPRGQETDNIEHVELEWWLERLAEKGQVEGIQALPAWPEVGDNPSNNSGEEEMPKKWQDFLKGSAKKKISAW
ncbi:hypothetical protein H9Q69_001373 [Fusarium xylarioides]|uniref:Uncharacterized protein n=1 Tax=Fusarium xylarioides TaxID=221167 RepID=A0A9P7LPW9_9HYPO|nr:hypothetical protein H9Q70_001698 [Fusarium xylarioides]KAG5770838.1 hypothetical protein H9Q72_002401 [Fusarium xylarioides]KAG5778265.1 hypothetical protein H9Q73_008054 [Fusarium xylarioides]KAG5799636.1 hypothetical protein H9Q69_001373 [Fusarium xylarioides]KAG5814245.1 hypothetical protein H9Q71_003323 [Fusarium xylarioides]